MFDPRSSWAMFAVVWGCEGFVAVTGKVCERWGVVVCFERGSWCWVLLLCLSLTHFWHASSICQPTSLFFLFFLFFSLFFHIGGFIVYDTVVRNGDRGRCSGSYCRGGFLCCGASTEVLVKGWECWEGMPCAPPAYT